MFKRLRRWRQSRSPSYCEAQELIGIHGEYALQVARAKAVATINMADDVKLHCFRVLRHIEKHYGVKPQVDTATRYLQK